MDAGTIWGKCTYRKANWGNWQQPENVIYKTEHPAKKTPRSRQRGRRGRAQIRDSGTGNREPGKRQTRCTHTHRKSEKSEKSGERFSYGIHSGVCAAGIFSFSFNFLFPMCMRCRGPENTCVRLSVCVCVWKFGLGRRQRVAQKREAPAGGWLGGGRRQLADNNNL